MVCSNEVDVLWMVNVLKHGEALVLSLIMSFMLNFNKYSSYSSSNCSFCFSSTLPLPVSPPLSLCPLCFSVHQAAEGGSLRKMLGSERGVVEEWLSEFKVKALLSWLMSIKCSPGGHLCRDYFPRETKHCGCNNWDKREYWACKFVHVTSWTFQSL